MLPFQLEKLEQETVKWCREILRNSPMAIRLCKSAINAADDGHAGLQVPFQISAHSDTQFMLWLIWLYVFLSQQIAGDSTLLFYGTEEGTEGKTAYLERRKPDFSKFPRLPWFCLHVFCISCVKPSSDWENKVVVPCCCSCFFPVFFHVIFFKWSCNVFSSCY